jgi:hypothetical protein
MQDYHAQMSKYDKLKAEFERDVSEYGRRYQESEKETH